MPARLLVYSVASPPSRRPALSDLSKPPLALRTRRTAAARLQPRIPTISRPRPSAAFRSPIPRWTEPAASPSPPGYPARGRQAPPCPFTASNGHTEYPVKVRERTQTGNGSRQGAQGHKPSPMDRRYPSASPSHCRLSDGPGRPQPASPSSTQPRQQRKQAIDTGRARHDATTKPASSLSTSLSTSTQPPRS